MPLLTCAVCYGRGKKDDHACKACGGLGLVVQKTPGAYKVPAVTYRPGDQLPLIPIEDEK